MKRVITVILSILLWLPMATVWAQSITIGNYTFKDGGVYTGEIKGRKPHGKGRTVMKNGDVYEGNYVKGKRQGIGILFLRW